MEAEKRKRLKIKSYPFAPQELYDGRAVEYTWIKYLPFVLKPSFLKALVKAMHSDDPENEYVTVQCYDSLPRLDSTSIYASTCYKNPEFGYHFRLYPYFNKPEPGDKKDITRILFIEWHEKRKVVKTQKLTITEALNLLAEVLLNYGFVTTNEIRSLDEYTDNWSRVFSFNKYIHPASTRQAFRRSRLSTPKKWRPRTPTITTDLITSFIQKLYRIKYKTNLTKTPITLFNMPNKEKLFYFGDKFGAPGIPQFLFDAKIATRCFCCDLVVFKEYQIYFNPSSKDFLTKHKHTAIKERVRLRRLDPAKYSLDDAYRAKALGEPSPKLPKDFKLPLQVNEAKTPAEQAIATGVNLYYQTLYEISHGLRKQINKPALGLPRYPNGSVVSVTFIDDMGINHWEWDRKEVPLTSLKEFEKDKYAYQDSVVLCYNCEQVLTYRYAAQVNALHREIANARLDEEQQAAEIRPDRLQNVIQNFVYDIETVELNTDGSMRIVRPPLSTQSKINSGLILPNNTPHRNIILQHNTNPLDYKPGFMLAKGENKQYENVHIYSLSGKSYQVKKKDSTLYLGIELEVTPGQETIKLIEKAIEQPLIPQNRDYYYEETKYLGAKICNDYFSNQNTCVVKHDGSTANGFEIVSVPGTHKWHIEEGWKGFFEEDVDTEERKKLTPAYWLCGWANNGGKSNNPIYSRGDDARNRAPGNRPTCGIHIHVSRDAITPLQLGKLLFFINNPKNLKFIESISGRNEKQYAKIYQKKVSDGKILDTIMKGSRNSHDYIESNRKYEALNINTGKPTIEFRIFRSNVSKNGFMKNIDFVHALVTWCGTNSSVNQEHLTVDNFVKWVNTQRGVYKYLTQWLTAHKYLSVVHEFNPKYHNPIAFEDLSEDNSTINTIKVA